MNNTRVAKWDNVKFLMILCVVLGHTLYEFMGSNTEMAKGIYFFIYTFHMPVFIFLTGMFAKHMIDQKRYDRVIEYLFIYLVMKFLDYFGGCLTSVTKKDDFISLRFFSEIKEGLTTPNKGFHLFWEDGPAWFALAIAVFIFVTINIRNVDRKIVLTSAIVLGCLAGLDNHLGNHFASMRLCTFYPVFLMGYYTDRKIFEQIEKTTWHSKIVFSKLLSAAILIIMLAVSLIFSSDLYSKINFLKGKNDYMALGFGVNGVAYRLLCYILWMVFIIAVINICPQREYFWSWLGTRTMSIFIWHKFILIIILKLCYGKYFIKYRMPHYYIIAAICIAVIITVITAYLPEFRISRWTKNLRKKCIKVEPGEKIVLDGTDDSFGRE